MYRRGSGRFVLVVGVYVDDLIITGAEEREVEAFKVQMKKIFNISDLGLLSFYLGVVVHQDATSITLRQTHYAKRDSGARRNGWLQPCPYSNGGAAEA